MDQVLRVILAQCESVRTPRALSVAILARYGEWSQLQELRLRSPCDYPDADSYFRDALVTEFIRKLDLDLGNDKELAAIDSFWASETQCCRTNARLSRFLPNSLLIEDGDEAVYRFICDWRKELANGMTVLPDHLTPTFSGGATYADVGKLITVPDKMSSIPTVYANTTDLLPFFWETSWGACCLQRSPVTVRGNIFFTVPKDSEKHRGCGKEASIPVSLQLYVGRVLRRGLRKYGIFLETGQQTHRDLAKQASSDGTLSTLDMSNASDTVAKVLVQLVLPERWHALLSSLRAEMTRVQGKWVRLEKFSSMGNGFTFELETLIFASLARTVVDREGGDPFLVRCYGDDLIVPTEHAKSVLAALRYFGFTPNVKKSFLEGPFRESCGGDYFNGVPVRAHYLKELPDEPQQWIALANGLRRVDPTLRYNLSAWLECLKNIPSHIRRCRGPSSLGDLVIHDDVEWHNTSKKVLCEGGEELLFYRVYRPIPLTLNWHHWHEDVQLACTSLNIPSAGVTPREGVSGYRLGWVLDPAAGWWFPPGAVAP